jgi:hypothetical protein
MAVGARDNEFMARLATGPDTVVACMLPGGIDEAKLATR